ncbi:hypothetical protein [Nodularia sphaerocarpa]|uniref:hypothetical protein n=1 Tax=Nodularia sphaerocarpa TaxID=137816 RepID=UPI001EFAF474|nr:hypothetical protein [Nodularia sphaerocarpa]MDB9374646.1 hypothetical protein [Nodularia sphaerocarpa CS-585]MDB9379692.1 hypothetical protein [Nodularia sphaerocarpa CS-585A2]ULP74880.1 hypothetical protein BDGGKGIB_04551 [Nodularia sphaerocarpa UHCC 0038]
MSQFKFALATADDDAALRQRMALDRMEGNISVSFRREPSYFAGCQVQGEKIQVIKCTDDRTGEIIGLGSRLINRAFINGELDKLGYLADLRVNPDYRRGTLLARGYKYFQNLHQENPVSLYFSLILEENVQAIKNLTGGRAGLPQYHDMGRIYSPAIHLDLPKPEIKMAGISFQRGKPEILPEILAFVQKWRSQKQFAPHYDLADFHSNRLRGLKAEDFYLAIRNNELVGTLAAWEQQTFRQTHIEGYSHQFARMRFFYNLLSQVTPLKPLPSPGAMVPYFYLAFVALADNSPEIFRALLRQLYRDRYQGNWHYFIAGLHENDPLTSILKEYRRIDAGGRLFAIHYPDGAASFHQLDKRVPCVEIGAV